MDTLDIFNGIKSLQDIISLCGDTSDGETNILEFKSVHADLNSASKTDVGDFKLTLAKEMSAFTNTDSGILVVGFDGKTKKVSNKTPKLEDWLDRHMGGMLEPQLSGIVIRTIMSGRDSVAIVYIPKGGAIPYRVASVGSYTKKNLVREYFQRIGTSSSPLTESIVRAMYRSSDRNLDIDVYPEVIGMRDIPGNERGIIRLALKVKTDPARLITKYYLDTEAYILDNNLVSFRRKPFTIHSSTLKDQPIPPSGEIFEFDTFDIRSKIPKQSSGIYDIQTFDHENMDMQGTETISQQEFTGTYALYIITRFACDGMPMKTDKRLIIIGHDRAFGVGKTPLDSDGFGKCKVISWLSVDNALYDKIMEFMRNNKMELN